MGRKGNCWNSTGTKKVIHESLAEAYHHAWEMRSAGDYRPYVCKDCKKYHIGRPPTNLYKLLGEKKTRQSPDEVLTGKLIAVIKNGIKGE